MKGDIMNFFKDGLSVDESRISVLLIVFIVTAGFALWQFATIGIIDGSMLTLLAYLIGAITGINIVDKFKPNKQETPEYNTEEIGE